MKKWMQMGNRGSLQRPKMASEALGLLKSNIDIEIENEYVFDLMRYVRSKEGDISFKCKVNKINQGWTVIKIN